MYTTTTRQQTNPRYAHFKQQQYTVGDEEQFVEAIKDIKEWDNTSLNLAEDPLNRFLFHDFSFPVIYKYQEKINIIQTFKYMFYKFKKGIYIRIQNNKVSKFIPMSNANFVNEWSDKIQIDFDVFKQVSALDNRPYNERNINKFVKSWFCNNCLLRYEYPTNESDTNIANICNFFEELCQSRKIPDIDFFVNKRDFPLLTRNLTEPYYDIWGEDTPLISHKYDSYLPILSMSKTDAYDDILIPTHEDWARVADIWFADSRITPEQQEEQKEDDFLTKLPTAVFRGSSTGDGVTVATNTRLHLAYLSSLQKKQDDGNFYLNCGITKWNSRVKKLKGTPQLHVINPATLPFGLVDYMPLSEQRKYKYIVHVDGHVSAFRLSAMLKLNCVILMVESKWKMWYSDMLIPYEHYIPVKADLSDLYIQIDWCRENDEMCELIAYNAMEFADKYLCKDGILDYTQKVLTELKRFMTYEKCRQLTFPLPIQVPASIDSEEGDIIFENRNVVITKLRDKPLILKKKKNDFMMSHHYFSANVNFSGMYGVYKGQIVMDYIDGVKLYDYIAGKTFDFQVYINVLVQISYALYEVQSQMLFVHNDLTPWNIILRFFPDEQKISYCKGKYHVSSKVIPVIIDYDKVHLIQPEDYIHRGTVNQFKFSSIQDIITLLFTSLYQVITAQTLPKTEISLVLKLANFISRSEFHPGTFYSINQLKNYLYSMKKHSSLIYTDKKDLEKLTPLDFVRYLSRNNMCRKPRDDVVLHFPREIQYDEFTFWSPSRCEEIKKKKVDLNRLLKLREKHPTNAKILQNISDIVTFDSIYK